MGFQAWKRARAAVSVTSRLLICAATTIVVSASSDITAVQAAPCDPPVTNPIACENTLTGNPKSQWDLPGSDQGDVSIQGFTTDISYNKGSTVTFKISTPASAYHLDIYRMGYYQGNGARLITTLTPSASLPQTQPACLTNAASGLTDCGNWAASATWTIPSTAVSGIYFAKVIRNDTNGASHIMFIVRDDASNSPILFQTSDTAWQAYNSYGGNSLYAGAPGTNPGRAYKVSYNRPVSTRTTRPETWVFNAEYPMVRWLEANGYNVSYASGVDTDRRGATALQTHKIYMSVGHDEYWSAGQRSNVEAARAAGVNLAFFSANQTFWKTRYENSIDGSNTAYRTLVSYKETHANAVIDPADPPTWTGTWRDPRFSPPADGGKPENALAGSIFMVNGSDYRALQVPYAYSRLRFWRNTSIANLTSGQTATIGAGCTCLIGYEWNEDLDNGFRPGGMFDLSSSTYLINNSLLLDYGNNYGSGSATHSLTLYRYPNGGLVFGAGTVDYSWGLDGNHDIMTSTPDVNVQQATVNLLADMGAQPATLQSGLVAATASTDTTPPTSTINSPTGGASVVSGNPVVVTGTASDVGGVVAGVEVSTDGGATWHPASGTTNWTFNWTPDRAGAVTIRSRAVDDSANQETPSAGINVTVTGSGCGCATSFWSDSTVPQTTSANDNNSVELGLKFSSSQSGYVTGVRFYKGSGNGGTHVGSLWTTSGTQLGQVTFANETASGWQQASFASPIAVTANTTYVVSYHAPAGHYAADSNYFASNGFDNAPLHAPSNASSNGNGVYLYSASVAFPNNTYGATNYFVDVVFSTSASPTPTPTPTAGSPTATPTSTPTSAPQTCPCTIWPASTVPGNTANSDASSIEVGVKFRSDTAGWINGIRFYKGSGNGGTHVGNLWTSSGTNLGSATFTNETASGWQQVNFASPVAITANTTYVASYFAPQGHYAGDLNYFNTSFDRAPLHALSSASSGGNGVYMYSGSSAFPTNTYNASNYWVDVVLATSTTPTSTPTLTPTATVTPTLTNTPIPGTPTATPTNTPTPTPTPTPPPSNCPCTIWSTTATPGNTSNNDASSLEVGVKFQSDSAGLISGVRFYKGSGNAGTHVGNLWTISGTNLATATFTNETASGWQQVNFSSPVAINANTTYVATYFAPQGHYAGDLNYFTSNVDHAPLHALASGSSGGNGVYGYGASSNFPTGSYNASNYWVDVVFSTTILPTPTPTNSPTPGTPTATPTFTPTAVPQTCPCTLWPSSAAPTNPSNTGDSSSVEVGMKFLSDVSGHVSGVRFYKAATNTGTHIGSLWSSTGTLLAQATFTGETASGWQQVNFSSPVAITANTTYVVSYHAPVGQYADDLNYFQTSTDRAPLHGLSSGSSGGNGVYVYSANPAFPNNTYSAANYWVDLVLTTP